MSVGWELIGTAIALIVGVESLEAPVAEGQSSFGRTCNTGNVRDLLRLPGRGPGVRRQREARPRFRKEPGFLVLVIARINGWNVYYQV